MGLGPSNFRQDYTREPKCIHSRSQFIHAYISTYIGYLVMQVYLKATNVDVDLQLFILKKLNYIFLK